MARGPTRNTASSMPKRRLWAIWRLVGLQPAAYDFGCELLVALEVAGRMDVLGTPPNDRFNQGPKR